MVTVIRIALRLLFALTSLLLAALFFLCAFIFGYGLVWWSWMPMLLFACGGFAMAYLFYLSIENRL